MKYAAINFFLLAAILMIAGCQTATPASDYVTLTEADLSDEMVTYLKSRGTRIEACDNGSYRIHNSAEVRDAILKALKILRTQSNLIAENIAFSRATRMKSGGPYRRQFMKIHEDGTTSIKTDMSEFIKAYKPGHQDADEEGIVNMPNVNLTIEMVDMACTRREIYLFKDILERFDKTFVNDRQGENLIQSIYDKYIQDQQTSTRDDIFLTILASIRKSLETEPESTQVLLFRQALTESDR